MVKLKMFVVFDEKAKAYLQPFFFAEVGQAVRHFSDAVDDSQSIVSKHPEDFALFYAGEFDLTSGLLTAERTLVHLVSAIELRAEIQKRAEQLALQLSRGK